MPDDLILDAISRAEALHRQEEARWRAQEAVWEQRSRAAVARRDRTVMPYVQPTTVAEYAAFVRGFLANGGTIRYVRDRNLSGYWTVRQDIELPALYGANSVDLLVAEGRQVTMPDGPGHATICWMDGFRLQGAGLEMFTDVAAYLRREASRG
jgi:hypothetical protein